MKKIKIWRDDCPMNPFTEWDCEPPLMFESGRSNKTDYSDGDIKRFIIDKPTDNQIIRHQAELADILSLDLQYYKDYNFTKSEKASDIRYNIGDLSVEELAKICTLFKIPHYQYTSKGYSQGDWADVLIVLTDEFFERTGCDRKNSDSILDGTANLFNAYMWGDVFGYTIYEGKEVVKLSRADFEGGNYDNVEDEIDWEVTDSCVGFYGRNFLTNGILEELEEELREQALKSDEHSIY